MTVRGLNPDLIVTVGGGAPVDAVDVTLALLAEGADGLANYGVGPHLGTVANAPRCHCSWVMLPALLKCNQPVDGDQQPSGARALGDGNPSASDLPCNLIEELGIPTTLRAVNVARELLPAISSGAMQNIMVPGNSRPITSPDQVIEILEPEFWQP